MHYIVYGCGDASISRTENLYLIDEDYIIVKENIFHYNAPPTFTKEKALAEGVTNGWYDPSKTKIDSTVSYVFKRKVIKMVNKNGDVLNDKNSLYKLKCKQIFNEIDRILKFHPTKYNLR